MANIPKPITREDKYYSYLINGSGQLPTPVTRKDKYLYYLCVNGFGGGGTVTPEMIDAAVERYLKENPVELDVLGTAEAVEKNTAPGKLVDALVVKEVFQSVSEGKGKIASAITDKGVETDAEAAFDTMAENIGKIEGGEAGETYDGDYTVTPRVFEQNLATKAKVMADNVTVLAIPYSEVSNSEGGKTVTIG